MGFHRNLLLVALVALLPLMAAAQEKEKSQEELREEYIDKQIDKLTIMLDLEDWQVFYVDSTYRHDLAAMDDEAESMMKSKINNPSIYQEMRDRWEEKIDNTFKRVFTEEQWNKFLKNGEARKIKEREKRRAQSEAGANKKKK